MLVILGAVCVSNEAVLLLFQTYFSFRKKKKKKVRKERSMDIIHFPSLMTEISLLNLKYLICTYLEQTFVNFAFKLFQLMVTASK